MIHWWRVEHRDGLIAYELDFDIAAEGEELRAWIIRAELPPLRLFEPVTSPRLLQAARCASGRERAARRVWSAATISTLRLSACISAAEGAGIRAGGSGHRP